MAGTYYAVRVGVKPGIYTNWDECKKMVTGYTGARFKKFSTEDEAKAFIEDNEVEVENKTNEKCTRVHDYDCIIAFTDGCCLGNQDADDSNKKSGYAVVFPPPYYAHSQKIKITSNKHSNIRAELKAIIKSFKIADEIDPGKKDTLYIYTDSEYSINAATKWIGGWKARDWKKANGKIVENVDLIQQLDAVLNNMRPFKFVHVRAHTNQNDWASRWNAQADKWANEAAISYSPAR